MATNWADTLTPGQTKLRLTHLTELRNALNAEMVRRGMGSQSFTDASPVRARAIYYNEMRSKVQGFAPFTPTNTITAGQTPIRAIHTTEIRTKINALEAHPAQGGVSDCNAGCSGLCVGCTGSCTGGCTSCTGSCTGGCSSCTSCSGCSGTCSGTCIGGCEGGCGGGCDGSCTGGCTASCSDSCGKDCTGGCFNNCSISSG